jgi:hypothetical protein
VILPRGNTDSLFNIAHIPKELRGRPGEGLPGSLTYRNSIHPSRTAHARERERSRQLRRPKLFFQIANEVLQSLFGPWIDRPGGRSARLSPELQFLPVATVRQSLAIGGFAL